MISFHSHFTKVKTAESLLDAVNGDTGLQATQNNPTVGLETVASVLCDSTRGFHCSAAGFQT